MNLTAHVQAISNAIGVNRKAPRNNLRIAFEAVQQYLVDDPATFSVVPGPKHMGEIVDDSAYFPYNTNSPRTEIATALRVLQHDLAWFDRSNVTFNAFVTDAECALYGSAVNAYVNVHHLAFVKCIRKFIRPRQGVNQAMFKIFENMGVAIHHDVNNNRIGLNIGLHKLSI